MDLYTSLVRLKQEMNDGQLPPMMPVTGSALKLIDPVFTIGLGALREDPALGLQCPVRGCGVYYHGLTSHLNVAHQDVGGARAVYRALSIPRSASLISSTLRQKLQAAQHRGIAVNATLRRRPGKSRAKQSKSLRASRATVGARNLSDTCVAQLSHRIIDLSHSLGRSPSSREFQRRYGDPLLKAVMRSFGSWNNALGACGQDVWYTSGGGSTAVKRQRKDSRLASVLAGLSAWHMEHGSLPRAEEAAKCRRAPYLRPSLDVLTALSATDWDTAMCRAAALLDIHGGRYGLPVREPASVQRVS